MIFYVGIIRWGIFIFAYPIMRFRLPVENRETPDFIFGSLWLVGGIAWGVGQAATRATSTLEGAGFLFVGATVAVLGALVLRSGLNARQLRLGNP